MKTWFKIVLLSCVFIGSVAQAASDDCPLKNLKKSMLLSDNSTNFVPRSVPAAASSQNLPAVRIGN